MWNELILGRQLTFMLLSFSSKHNKAMSLPLFQRIRCIHVSFDIKLWKRGKVGENFGDFFAEEYYHACCRSKTFNLHATVSVQNLSLAFFVLLIDTWYKSFQVKTVQLEKVNQTKTLFIREICSTWSKFSDTLSP